MVLSGNGFDSRIQGGGKIKEREMQETNWRNEVVKDQVLPRGRKDLLVKVSEAIDRLENRDIKRIVIYLRQGEVSIDPISY